MDDTLIYWGLSIGLRPQIKQALYELPSTRKEEIS